MKKFLAIGGGTLAIGVVIGSLFILVVASSLIGLMMTAVAGVAGAAAGNQDGCSWGGTSPVDYQGGDWSYGGETFNAKQIANMQAIIGIAKTMYPAQAEQASIVGLITSRTEASFKVYANDGIVNGQDNNAPSWQLAYYLQLAHSLTLPHDAVGSDHSSVGIMQQQVIGGWGTVGSSNYQTDINNVISRLMNPSFAAARFFESMGNVSGWATMPPGDVAQSVQVSAFPDAYASHIALAQAIWAQFGATSPALQIPDGIGGTGSPESPANSTACDGGGGSIAAGTDQQLAQQIMAAANQGKVLWWEPAARTQVAAYAEGTPVSTDCQLDTRVLQLLVMATQMYDVFSVNSLNRRCIGDEAGIGQTSQHWATPGRAIDFGHFNGVQVTGGDPQSIRFIKAFDAIAPRDSGLGQLNCRGGVKITTFNEFDDTCHHLHVDVRGDAATNPLRSSPSQ